VALTSFFTIRRRRRAQQANLAYIRNAQAQANVYEGHLPNYQPNYPAYSPNTVPNQPTPQAYYPPPPGPPPFQDTKGHGNPQYDPANAPQFPPPTYSHV